MHVRFLRCKAREICNLCKQMHLLQINMLYSKSLCSKLQNALSLCLETPISRLNNLWNKSLCPPSRHVSESLLHVFSGSNQMSSSDRASNWRPSASQSPPTFVPILCVSIFIWGILYVWVLWVLRLNKLTPSENKHCSLYILCLSTCKSIFQAESSHIPSLQHSRLRKEPVIFWDESTVVPCASKSVPNTNNIFIVVISSSSDLGSVVSDVNRRLGLFWNCVQ